MILTTKSEERKRKAEKRGEKGREKERKAREKDRSSSGHPVFFAALHYGTVTEPRFHWTSSQITTVPQQIINVRKQ